MIRRYLQKICILIVGLIFGVIMTEITLQLFWHPPYLNPAFLRNDLSWLSQNVSLNRFGYRDRESNLLKDKGTFRIYSLGDSYTYGWYINDPSLSYPKVLENLLREKFGKEKTEVINASRPGFNFYDEVNRLENEGILFEPNLITVGINAQDLASREFPPNFVKNDLIKSLKIYQLIFGNLERLRVARLTDKEIKDTYTDGSPQIKKAEQIFSRLSQLAKSVNAKVAIIIFPQYDPSNPNGPYRYPEFHRLVKDVASKYSIQVVDLLEPFGQVSDKKQLVLNPIDPHPSILANKLVAEAISRTLNFDELLSQPRLDSLLRRQQARLGTRLLNLLGIISIEPKDWVFFDQKFGLNTERLFLPETTAGNVTYLENILKTAKSFTHEGWPGAELEYNLLGQGKILKIPQIIYGYKVVGISQVTAFWRNKGSLNSTDLDFSQVSIQRSSGFLSIETHDPKKFELYRITMDVSVNQLDIDNGEIVSMFSTNILEGKAKSGQDNLKIDYTKKIGSLPKFISRGTSVYYAWVDNQETPVNLKILDGGLLINLKTLAVGDLDVEVPVAGELHPSDQDLPTVNYI